MTLHETIQYIENKHTQEFIPIDEFDNTKNGFIEKLNPKFLYRGEKIYNDTKSNYHRNEITQDETNFILDLSKALYIENFGEVNPTSIEYQSQIDNIGAILQHYGFSIMWLDFTESIEIAAFFASYKNNSGKGRIWVSETNKLIENDIKIYKLNSPIARRPIRQKAYALRMFDDYSDFQNNQFYNSFSYNFELTDDDKLIYNNRYLLDTSDDPISDFIIEYIDANPTSNTLLMKKLETIKENLKTNQIS